MIAIQTKFQAVVFVNAIDILPTPDNISFLLHKFSDIGLLPSTFQEMSPAGINLQPRIRLNSQTGEWIINIGSSRIDIEKNAINNSGDNLGEIEDFVNQSIDFLDRIFSHFKKKASRLTLSTRGLLREMNLEELNDVYSKFFVPTKFYNDARPFEWSQSNAAQIGPIPIGKVVEDYINVISVLSRVRGNLLDGTVTTQFDRIEIAFDINTIADNTDPRYDSQDLRPFFDAALNFRREILIQYESAING